MELWIIAAIYGVTVLLFWFLFRYFAIYKESGFFFQDRPVTLREIALCSIWPLVLIWYVVDPSRKQ